MEFEREVQVWRERYASCEKQVPVEVSKSLLGDSYIEALMLRILTLVSMDAVRECSGGQLKKTGKNKGLFIKSFINRLKSAYSRLGFWGLTKAVLKRIFTRRS
jgi:hypothetical protein